MSWYDKLSQIAVESGRSPQEYYDAAGKHAQAAFIYIIITGFVWYFFGFVWAMVPLALCVYTAFQGVSASIVSSKMEEIERAKAPSHPTTTSHPTAMDDYITIIEAYGKVLESSAPPLGCVADVNKLPYTKQKIKLAILAGLRAVDVPQMQEYLKFAYVQLANWQEGVGENNQGIDLSKIKPGPSKEEMVNYTKDFLDQYPTYEHWMKIVNAESEILMQELRENGF